MLIIEKHTSYERSAWLTYGVCQACMIVDTIDTPRIIICEHVQGLREVGLSISLAFPACLRTGTQSLGKRESSAFEMSFLEKILNGILKGPVRSRMLCCVCWLRSMLTSTIKIHCNALVRVREASIVFE